MTNTLCLDEKYSTTKLVTQEKPEIINNPEDKFETVLFLPEGVDRKGEGGLRTKGYFKKSFENKPLISIITVVFNGEKYLEETIQSVINQTYDNVEYIIIDGGSTDGTLDIIKKYEDKIDYWLSEKDNGIYDAWNKAVRMTSGEWISFLGADDYYLDKSLELYVKFINDNNISYDYISSKVNLITQNKEHIRIIGKNYKWEIFRRYMNVAHVGSLHNIKLFKEVGLYDTKYKIAADYELLLRKKEQLSTGYIDIISAYMRDGGISHRGIQKVFSEVVQAKTKTANINIFIAYFDFFVSFAKYFIRRMY